MKAKFNKYVEMKNRDIVNLNEEMSRMAVELDDNKTIKAKDSPVKHVSKEDVYHCDQCEKTYVQKKRFETHIKEKHSK